MQDNNVIESIGYKIIEKNIFPSKKAEYVNIYDYSLHDFTKKYLSVYDYMIYKHQYIAIELFKKNKNICISTSTNSGKSLIFYASAIELLSENANAKILAIYPLKALGNQQEKNWNNAISAANLNCKVGLIDGDTSINERFDILINSNIIIITPDVIHSWLLLKLEYVDIQQFIKNIELIIADEIHAYTGVFGSNSAYLFRRLNHAVFVLKGTIPKYITASATIENPENFLDQLFGLPFEIINNSMETSGKHEVEYLFLESIHSKDIISNLIDLITYYTRETDFQSIVFLDSRKMVEQVVSMVGSKLNNDDEFVNNTNKIIEFNDFNNDNYKIYPYRAGYEKHDSKIIQNALSQGGLKSIVSTSALEMGLDIKSLDVCILFGIPNSSTSFHQRIGRIGRHKKGLLLILNDNSLKSTQIFKDPSELFQLPLTKSTLYLENERLQYIQALCFAGIDLPQGAFSEYDKLSSCQEDFETSINFPNSFIEMCIHERNGVVPQNYRDVKIDIENYPNLSYPLRVLEPQFKVQLKDGKDRINLGSISHDQIMREAYPCAVYYYAGRPYRVIKISFSERIVTVKRERYYYTKPIFYPTKVVPNFDSNNVQYSKKFDSLIVVECELSINEIISGIREKQGSRSLTREYPIDDGYISFSKKYFTRYYFTSGILLFHPVFNNPEVKLELIVKLIYEIFLLKTAYESQDIGFAKSKIKADNFSLKKDDKFIAIYDKTYGSLKLTSKVTNNELLIEILEFALILINGKSEYISQNIEEELNSETLNALYMLRDSMLNGSKDLIINSANTQQLIVPTSQGININNGIVCTVRSVFYSPRIRGLMYKVRYKLGTAIVSLDLTIEELEPIEGVSILDDYDIDKGDFVNFEL